MANRLLYTTDSSQSLIISIVGSAKRASRARLGRDAGKTNTALARQSRTAHARRSAAEPRYFLKMLFGILTCTPMVPSTSCVIATSPATLVS